MHWYIPGTIVEHNGSGETNWYARQLTQGPVGATWCPFNSYLRHQPLQINSTDRTEQPCHSIQNVNT